MAKVKMVLGWCIPMVLVVVALMTPAIARAGSIKIWPDQLNPAEPNDDYYQDVSHVRSSRFYAPLSLPWGSRITKITYYHLGDASPAETWLILMREKMGNMPEQIASGISTDFGATIIPVEAELMGDLIIRTGYQYYILVSSWNDNSLFLGAKITYRE